MRYRSISRLPIVVDAMALFLKPSPYLMAVTDNSPSDIIESTVKSAGRASATEWNVIAAAKMTVMLAMSARLKSVNFFMPQNYNQIGISAITIFSEKAGQCGYMEIIHVLSYRIWKELDLSRFQSRFSGSIDICTNFAVA